MCPPKIPKLKPNEMVFRWGLWEVIRSRRGSPHGIELVLLLKKKGPRKVLTLFSYVRIQQSRKLVSPDNELASALSLEFPASRNLRNKHLLFISHPINGILLRQLKWTKTTGLGNNSQRSWCLTRSWEMHIRYPEGEERRKEAGMRYSGRWKEMKFIKRINKWMVNGARNWGPCHHGSSIGKRKKKKKKIIRGPYKYMQVKKQVFKT